MDAVELTGLPMFAVVRRCCDDGHEFSTLDELGWDRDDAERNMKFSSSDSYSKSNPVMEIAPVTVTITRRK